MIERAFVDSGFRPEKADMGDEHMVYQWCHRHDYFAYPTKGRDTLGGRPFQVSKIEVDRDGAASKYSIDLVHINTDFFKGLIHSRLRTPLDEAGAFFLHNDADEDYARQIISEVRVIGEKLKPEWMKRQRDNHFLDCEALAAAAAYMLNVQQIPEGVERTFALPDLPGSAKPATSAAAQPEATVFDRFRKMAQRHQKTGR
ncbi:terminase gpA endonuclease subunit [Devosia ginsengisoli]|uniref:terminase gpA endonuclease subunit n=1 Tax=Devosia ginsengisoli TaxID=400770 RepID=UPI0026EF1E0D|nr:terminase gpA endonuclease subunit [Devosia ginsengisoli]MCR6673241.1 phage terminase large subunit family protein [Devosia ginsengisoli]